MTENRVVPQTPDESGRRVSVTGKRVLRLRQAFSKTEPAYCWVDTSGIAQAHWSEPGFEVIWINASQNGVYDYVGGYATVADGDRFLDLFAASFANASYWSVEWIDA